MIGLANLKSGFKLPYYNDGNFGGVVTYYPKDAYWVVDNNATGTLKIRLPFAWIGAMITMKIRWYDYTSGKTGEAIVGGYNYDVGTQWINTTAVTTAFIPLFSKVRFASDGVKCCILLGDLTTTWSYTKLVVESITVGYKGTQYDWSTGWAISLLASETGIVTTATVNNTISVLGNYGADGYIPKWLGGLLTGTSNIFDNGTNVAIGHTSPSTKLDVAGNLRVYGSTGIPTVYFANESLVNKWHIGYSSSLGSGGFNFAETDVADARLFLAAGGKVGIGTSSPSYELELKNATNARMIIRSAAGKQTGLLLSDLTGTAFNWHIGHNLDNAADGKFFIYDSVNSLTRMVIHAGNFGFNTITPYAGLDNATSSIKPTNCTYRKEFTLNFPNGVANQKIDIYFNTTVSGYFDVTLTDSYNNQSAAGCLTKRFYIGLNPNNSIWLNNSRVIDDGGTTADNYAISDLSWDATNSRYKITIVHRVSTGNSPVCVIDGACFYAVHANTFVSTVTVGSVYTTDTTVYGRQYVNFLNNVGIGTSNPASMLQIGKDSTYTNEDGAGIAIKSTGANNTKLVLGADSVNTCSFIQSLSAGSSWSDRPLALMPNGGNVGVGTRTPGSYAQDFGQYLDLVAVTGVGNIGIGCPVNADSVVGNLNFYNSYIGAGSDCRLGIIRCSRTGANTSGKLDFYTRNSGSWVNAMTVLPGGNVGIGATNPYAALAINQPGSGTSMGIMAQYAAINTAATVGTFVVGSGYLSNNWGNMSNVIFESAWNAGSGYTDSFIRFSTTQGGVSTGERMRIDRAGNVGIGTTSPSTLLHLKAASSSPQLELESGNAGGGGDILFRGTPDGIGYYHSKIRSLRDTGTNYRSYLAFFTEDKASGTTDASSERMRIDYLGRVGINTTSPGSQLEVNGVIRTTSDQNYPTAGVGLEFTYNAVSNIGYVLAYDRTGSAYKDLRLNLCMVKAGGALGVNTQSPQKIMHVASPVTGGSNGDAAQIALSSYTPDTYYAAIGAYQELYADRLGLKFNTYGADGHQTRMWINAAGNVSVGTNAASAVSKFEVWDSGATANMRVINNPLQNTRLEMIADNANNRVILYANGSATSPDILFQSGGVDRFKISSTGVLTITDPAVGTGTDVLIVEAGVIKKKTITSSGSGTSGTSGSQGAAGSNGTSGTSGSSGISVTGGSGSSGTSGTSGSNGSNGSSGTSGTSGTRGAAGSNGTSGTSGSSGSTSDRRAKKNIRAFKDGLDVLLKLNAVEWEYNGLAGTVDGQHSIGVVAQDVEDKIPYCVFTEQRKLNPDDEEYTDIYGINPSHMHWVAVNAIKELTAELDMLKSRVSQLESIIARN